MKLRTKNLVENYGVPGVIKVLRIKVTTILFNVLGRHLLCFRHCCSLHNCFISFVYLSFQYSSKVGMFIIILISVIRKLRHRETE